MEFLSSIYWHHSLIASSHSLLLLRDRTLLTGATQVPSANEDLLPAFFNRHRIGIGFPGSVVAKANVERESAVKGSTLGARERRLHKAQDEKRRREEGNKDKYPDWATILEHACEDDKELREIIGDSLGDPEEMRKRVEERVRRKGRDIIQPKTGSAVPMKVTFRDFDATDSYFWMELYSSPSEKDMEIIGSIIRAWYVLGRLGGFNSLNMQVSKIPINQSLSYNENVTDILPACFHNIGELEFQDNWGRVWVDIGTADPIALDVLINSLSAASSDYVGIKELTFRGRRLGDWDEGMTSKEDGYRSYKI